MPRFLRLAIAYAVVFAACAGVYLSGWGRPAVTAQGPTSLVPSMPLAVPDGRPVPDGLDKVTLASGCFWCTESDFDEVNGVVSTTSGYTGGRVPHPTYEQVSAGGTGHVESVEIVYDPSVVTFEQLLDHYWRNVDFFNDHGQFCDLGEQYRPVIFVHDAAQRAAAEASRARLQQRFSKPIVVEVQDAGVFYPAEAYHQDYSRKNPVRYRFYRWSCGRDRRLAEIWKSASPILPAAAR